MFCLPTVSTNILITYNLQAFFPKKLKMEKKEKEGNIENERTKVYKKKDLIEKIK